MSAKISTTIKNRKSTPGEIIGSVLGSIILLIIAYFLVDADHAFGSWLPRRIVVFINAFSRKETASCPNCKHQFDNIDTFDRWFLCPACEKYLERKPDSRAQLEMIEDDYICEDLIFKVKCPGETIFLSGLRDVVYVEKRNMKEALRRIRLFLEVDSLRHYEIRG